MEEPTSAQNKKCETTAESENDNVMETPENAVDSNKYILKRDELRIIFGYLNARDLSTTAMVCRYVTCTHSML